MFMQFLLVYLQIKYVIENIIFRQHWKLIFFYYSGKIIIMIGNVLCNHRIFNHDIIKDTYFLI